MISKTFLSLCILFALSNVLLGQDDDEKWQYIGSTIKEYIYIDKTSISQDKNYIKCWVKMVCHDDCLIESEFKELEYSMGLYTVECKKEYVSIERFAEYHDDGYVYTKPDRNHGFEPVFPNTISEAVLRYVCSFY